MAHFAQLDEANIVTQVIVVNNGTTDDLPFPQSEPIGVEFCRSLFGGDTRWKQTSYNGNFRKKYASIGYLYDDSLDAFIPPKPFESWSLNTETGSWEPPSPMPQDGGLYRWDEETLSWVSIIV